MTDATPTLESWLERHPGEALSDWEKVDEGFDVSGRYYQIVYDPEAHELSRLYIDPPAYD